MKHLIENRIKKRSNLKKTKWDEIIKGVRHPTRWIQSKKQLHVFLHIIMPADVNVRSRSPHHHLFLKKFSQNIN